MLKDCANIPKHKTYLIFCRANKHLFTFLIPTDIRHPEELSLLRPVEEKKKKKDKDLTEEIYDLTEVPLSSGTPTTSLFFTH